MNDLFIYAAAFFAILYGAGIIVNSVDKFSHKLKLSSFSVSFFILGILTSIPEFAVGLTAISEKNPDIFIGNLIGGSVVIFFVVIPILAALGGGVKLTHQLSKDNLFFAFFTIISPLLLLLDQRLTNFEGSIMIGLYVILFFLIERDRGVFDGQHSNILNTRSYSFFDILKILFGVALVFVSSNLIVSRTIMFAAVLGISPFYMSLVVLALGTNLPELSLAVKSILFKKKDIAFGDYLGSAAANTLFFGVFTILHPAEVTTQTSFFVTFFLVLAGLCVFYYFTKSERNISKKEGLVLLLFYLLFILIEKL